VKNWLKKSSIATNPKRTSLIDFQSGFFAFIERRDLMPRKNKRKTEPHKHAPSAHDKGFKQKCLGCAFVGEGFMCMTRDGKCLKTKPPQLSKEVAAG